MAINALLSLILLIPIILGMVMVSHNTYKFFGSHPELGLANEKKAITIAVAVFLVSALVVASPLIGTGGALDVFASVVSLAYVGIALYYLKKWVMQTIHTTHDELTKCASAISTVTFQKSAMGITALLLSSGKSTEPVSDEQRNEIIDRINHARAFDHLPTDALVGYFQAYLGDIEHPVCMYARENTLDKVKKLTGQSYETDIAMKVAASIVGGKHGKNLDRVRLEQVARTLGLDPANYCH
jgi:tellurite resistance protein